MGESGESIEWQHSDDNIVGSLPLATPQAISRDITTSVDLGSVFDKLLDWTEQKRQLTSTCKWKQDSCNLSHLPCSVVGPALTFRIRHNHQNLSLGDVANRAGKLMYTGWCL